MSIRWERSLLIVASALAGAGCKTTHPQETPIPERAPAASESVAPSGGARSSASSDAAIDTGRTASAAPIAPAHARTHFVKHGDTLFSIARLYFNGDASKWRSIYEANRDKIPDKDHIKVGQELVIPD